MASSNVVGGKGMARSNTWRACGSAKLCSRRVSAVSKVTACSATIGAWLCPALVTVIGSGTPWNEIPSYPAVVNWIHRIRSARARINSATDAV